MIHGTKDTRYNQKYKKVFIINEKYNDYGKFEIIICSTRAKKNKFL